MSFASLEFFIFFPVIFGLYFLSSNKRWQNSLLVAASYVFYGWWDYRFCGLIFVSSLADYIAGLGLAACTVLRLRQGILVVAVAFNLLLLGFFKYFNFFVDSLAITLSAAGLDFNTSTLTIILPVGISFYTFQTMSYTLDVYRRKTEPQRDFVDYLAYVSFFPQLVAGPIERASRLMPQFQRPRTFSLLDAEDGCRLILWGLFKKMVLADNLAPLVSAAYGNPEQASAASLALGTISFAFQIYCDFSAYSDIAAGAALLLGIRLTRNFDYPYFSRTIGEFWRRWHISLASWFKDYVYVPLGGSRSSTGQTVRNLCVTFLLSGLWHGAAWKFVFWGAFHGVCLSAAHWFSGRGWEHNADSKSSAEGNSNTVWRELRGILCTFCIVCFGWILFRADSLRDAATIVTRIGGGLLAGSFYYEVCERVWDNVVLFGALAVFVGLEWKNRDQWNPMPLPSRSVVGRWCVYTALCWAVLLFGTNQTGDFIYFQF